MESVKDILINKVSEFKECIIWMCENEEFKNKINDSFKDIWISKIMLFIFLINNNKMENQINEFINKFNIIDNDINKNKIKEYYNYFLDVKNILL